MASLLDGRGTVMIACLSIVAIPRYREGPLGEAESQPVLIQVYFVCMRYSTIF